MTDIKNILESAETIAVVGCSTDPRRTSTGIARYLKEAGYTMVPVNPNHDVCHNETCYPDVVQIPDYVRLDIVCIFRNPRYTADMVRDVVRRVKETGERPVIWTQLGVSTPEAERVAEEAGLPYVRNRCILVERERVLY